MLTDALGIPLSIAVDGTNRHDMKISRETLENIKAIRPKPTEKKEQRLCLDKGYDYDEVRELVKGIWFYCTHSFKGRRSKRDKKESGAKSQTLGC